MTDNATDTTEATDTEAVVALERRRFDATVAADTTTLTELFHPELLYTHTNGATDTAESYVRKLRDGVWDFHRIDHPVGNVVIAGDTALVLGEMHAELTTGGTRKQLANVTLAVWLREHGKWRLIAFHPTPKP